MNLGQAVELTLAIASGLIAAGALLLTMHARVKDALRDPLVVAAGLGALGLVLCDVVWVMRLV